MAGLSVGPSVFLALMEAAELALDRRPLDRRPLERRQAGRRLAHALLRIASGTDGWAIATDPDGRPWAYHPGTGSRFALSITHSGSLVAAAACDRGEVGIDVERRRAGRRHQGIADLAFGPRERRLVARHGPGAFYRLWTLREAMGKATGQGLAMVVDAVDRVPADPHTGYWVSPDSRWLLAHLEPLPEVSLALAVRSDTPLAGDHWTPRCQRWFDRLDAVEDACVARS